MTSLLDDVDFDGVELDIDVPTKEQMRTRHIELQSKSANLCKFFQKGTCLKGNKCPFNHSRGEKQVPLCSCEVLGAFFFALWLLVTVKTCV